MGYLSGQDGVIVPATSCKKHFSLKPYHKSFIDQACSVKLADCRCSFFAHLWTSTPPRSAKIRTLPISCHLNRTSLVNKPYLQKVTVGYFTQFHHRRPFSRHWMHKTFTQFGSTFFRDSTKDCM